MWTAGEQVEHDQAALCRRGESVGKFLQDIVRRMRAGRSGTQRLSGHLGRRVSRHGLLLSSAGHGGKAKGGDCVADLLLV
jgi:hypothetical protein